MDYTLSNRISQLASPPRPVPLRVACRAMLGITGTIGAIFLLSGMVLLWGFGSPRPIAELRLALSSATAEGTITGIAGTDISVNESRVDEYQFTFRTPSEQTITGRCYTTYLPQSVGERVDVQYVPEKPSIARITDCHLSPLQTWMFLPMLIFPGTGAVLFTIATTGGLRQVRLLQHGEVAGGEVISGHATNVRVNDIPVIAYTYKFEAHDGGTYQGSSKALPSGRIGDEAQEPVLYLPWNPKRSMLVDTLPLRYPLDVDDYGQWATQERKWPVVWFALIWAGIAASVIYGLTTCILPDL